MPSELTQKQLDQILAGVDQIEIDHLTQMAIRDNMAKGKFTEIEYAQVLVPPGKGYGLTLHQLLKQEVSPDIIYNIIDAVPMAVLIQAALVNSIELINYLSHYPEIIFNLFCEKIGEKTLKKITTLHNERQQTALHFILSHQSYTAIIGFIHAVSWRYTVFALKTTDELYLRHLLTHNDRLSFLEKENVLNLIQGFIILLSNQEELTKTDTHRKKLHQILIILRAADKQRLMAELKPRSFFSYQEANQEKFNKFIMALLTLNENIYTLLYHEYLYHAKSEIDLTEIQELSEESFIIIGDEEISYLKTCLPKKEIKFLLNIVKNEADRREDAWITGVSPPRSQSLAKPNLTIFQTIMKKDHEALRLFLNQTDALNQLMLQQGPDGQTPFSMILLYWPSALGELLGFFNDIKATVSPLKRPASQLQNAKGENLLHHLFYINKGLDKKRIRPLIEQWLQFFSEDIGCMVLKPNNLNQTSLEVAVSEDWPASTIELLLNVIPIDQQVVLMKQAKFVENLIINAFFNASATVLQQLFSFFHFKTEEITLLNSILTIRNESITKTNLAIDDHLRASNSDVIPLYKAILNRILVNLNCFPAKNSKVLHSRLDECNVLRLAARSYKTSEDFIELLKNCDLNSILSAAYDDPQMNLVKMFEDNYAMSQKDKNKSTRQIACMTHLAYLYQDPFVDMDIFLQIITALRNKELTTLHNMNSPDWQTFTQYNWSPTEIDDILKYFHQFCLLQQASEQASVLPQLDIVLTILIPPVLIQAVEPTECTHELEPEATLTEPVIAEPVIAEPVTAEPIITEPIITEPVIAEPAITEPAITEPAITEPAIAEPVIAEPVTAEPVIAEPVTAEPAITAPFVIEPEPAPILFTYSVKATCALMEKALKPRIPGVINEPSPSEPSLPELEKIMPKKLEIPYDVLKLFAQRSAQVPKKSNHSPQKTATRLTKA